MNKIFLNTAKKFQSGDDDELQQAIEEALSGQRPVIEELLNRELVPEEDFLKGLAEELQRDPNVVLMGEEVAQFKGSYKVSEGLLEKFGPSRIIDTPISEAAFSGLAVGASMMGMRPVVEFMFWSFCYVAFDQIFKF